MFWLLVGSLLILCRFFFAEMYRKFKRPRRSWDRRRSLWDDLEVPRLFDRYDDRESREELRPREWYASCAFPQKWTNDSCRRRCDLSPSAFSTVQNTRYSYLSKIANQMQCFCGHMNIHSNKVQGPRVVSTGFECKWNHGTLRILCINVKIQMV